ncbi:efflux RND transporter periplasmic adaptor subunit [Helicobacter mesocricetorum]|uniref:efflux RND transporter periplasmic adaptor subunit n=1 Tax=Helicobacter mesocricetorum TaxID=87012 RepID=UPI000CF19CCD|nr:efflux RND transporter periplasmic adaptor subunit [Helicobacter mesocricetorum]
MKTFILCVLFFSYPILANPTLIVAQPIKNGAFTQNHSYIGSLYFSERSFLASEISGVIEEMFVKEGDKIKKDQPLAQLNSDLLDKEIATKKALLQQAQAILKKSTKDFQRYESLYKSNSIAYKEYEDALFDLQAQEGNKNAIASQLQLLQTQLQKKTIKAPYDAVILEKTLKIGEWVSAGASVFKIAKLTPLEATIEVPFTILRSLKVGDSIETSIAGKDYPSKIIAIIPLGDSKARTFPIKLSIEDKKGELIEGLEVKAHLHIQKEKDSLLVPRESIVPTQNGYAIFVIKDNKAKQVMVNINGYEGFNASIKPLNITLSTEDRVITEGNERLRDGEAIRE